MWFEISAPHAPPRKLNYDEYTDRTLSVGKGDGEVRGLATRPHKPILRK